MLQTSAMPKKTAGRGYWLFKSDPETYGFADLLREREQRTVWEGVRNYQARNLLRDDVQAGDGVLFYHSSSAPPQIVGICRVARAGYPDPTAPVWTVVDLQAVRPLPRPLDRAALAKVPALAKMELLRRGSRLSIQPVTVREWQTILELSGLEADSW